MPDTHPNAPSRPFGGLLLKGIGLILALAALFAGALFWFFGVDHHHETASTILPGRVRDLTPPTATDIILRRDFFLDHSATYIVSEEDLVAFLDEYFGGSDRSAHDPGALEHVGAERDWTWSAELVEFHCSAANGSGSSYFHDRTSGQTYQVSAHW